MTKEELYKKLLNTYTEFNTEILNKLKDNGYRIESHPYNNPPKYILIIDWGVCQRNQFWFNHDENSSIPNPELNYITNEFIIHNIN